MMHVYTVRLFFLVLILFFMQGCGREFLELKPNQRQKVPTTIADYLAILDNAATVINPVNTRSSHTLGIIGADEYDIPPAVYTIFPVGLNYDYQKNAYEWNAKIYQGGEGGVGNPTDFDTGYQRILLANLVLEGMAKIEPADSERQLWNLTKGTALFHRAWNYYCLLQLYAPVYNASTAKTDLGLPLRLESDPTKKISRASVFDCFQLLITDLRSALELLPDKPLVKFRPSKQAVLALLARVYLQLEDYENAADFASSCIDMAEGLIDYNTIKNQTYPFPMYGTTNSEVLFMMTAFRAVAYSDENLAIRPEIYHSYEEEDLRKALFFELDRNGFIRYRGSYFGDYLLFTGLALDEVYLIRAECKVRNGKLDAGLADINLLLKNRYKKDAFMPLASSNSQELLTRILQERKKELLLRGTRWEDLRRLNKESKTATVLRRKIAEKEVQLLPNSPRYVLPFPEEAISVGGYPQNLR